MFLAPAPSENVGAIGNMTSDDPQGGLNSRIGPPDQVAVLSHGRLTAFNQPLFPDPQRPMKFSLIVGMKVQTALMFYSPTSTFLWIRSQFVDIRNPQLRLDNQFFYGCEIRDSIVEYGGGLTDFGNTNTVVNSMILPGYPAVSNQEMLRIMNAFPWRSWDEGPPNLPQPLPPPSISPRDDPGSK
jgi:hypothetical protein